jgi:hypothetical protein
MTRNRFAQSVFAPLLLLVGAMQTQTATLQQQPVGQPKEERDAQIALPRSDDPIWLTLMKSKVRYNDKTGLYSIAVTPETKALNGQKVTVSGFVLPMDGSDHTKHFLLTRNTPVCLFCPPGEPNEVVEVVSPRAVNWSDKIVTITGQMSLINNGENGLFFKIAAAQVK